MAHAPALADAEVALDGPCCSGHDVLAAPEVRSNASGILPVLWCSGSANTSHVSAAACVL
jgi:hypothetical protein